MSKKATAKTATATTKKTKKDIPAPAGFDPNQHRQFVLNACYKGLREQSYQPMVAAAMLHSLGVTVDEGKEAAQAFGDAKYN
jgi:hypothetical protein